MGKGRTIASIVALVLVIGLLGACSSSSKSSGSNTATRTAAQARAAQVNIDAARRRLAATRLRVARQRRALAAALRRRQQEAAATSTTSTTVPTVAPPIPNTPVPGATTPAPQPATLASDALAIGRSINTVNAAFAKSVSAGIAASENANYYVAAGVYTAGQCSAFEAARGSGVVSDHLDVHAGSIVPAPGWVDSLLGAKPGGRVYAFTMDDVQTQVSTQEQRTQTVSTHAAVQPDGRALLFLRCQ